MFSLVRSILWVEDGGINVSIRDVDVMSSNCVRHYVVGDICILPGRAGQNYQQLFCNSLHTNTLFTMQLYLMNLQPRKDSLHQFNADEYIVAQIHFCSDNHVEINYESTVNSDFLVSSNAFTGL